MKSIKVLIIDDHKMIRDGLRVMLEMHKSRHSFIIDEAESGEEGTEKASKNAYDIILLDYQMGGMDGADTAKIIMMRKPNAKILALSNYNEYAYIDKMINEGGVKGYILKNIGPDELIKSIETVLSDKNYFSHEIAFSLLKNQKHPVKSKPVKTMHPKYAALSQREMDILRLIAEENSNDEIANKLDISRRTVDKHRQNIMLKLNVSNMVALIKVALQFTTQSI